MAWLQTTNSSNKVGENTNLRQKILSFYSRKWYIKTFIKKENLKLENENFIPIETNKREKKIKISGRCILIVFVCTV